MRVAPSPVHPNAPGESERVEDGGPLDDEDEADVVPPQQHRLHTWTGNNKWSDMGGNKGAGMYLGDGVPPGLDGRP